MFQEIKNINGFNEKIVSGVTVLAYFLTPDCNVCKILKPKVAELICTEFPQVELIYVDLVSQPALAAQQNVFIAPTIIVYLEGKEFIRKSRNIGIQELKKEIKRLYSILF